MPTVYMPGGHVDMHYHVAQPQQPVKPPSSRGSHSSDTSSAYSGSDTMQVSQKDLTIFQRYFQRLGQKPTFCPEIPLIWMFQNM